MRYTVIFAMLIIAACSTPKKKNQGAENQNKKSENSIVTSIKQAHQVQSFMNKEIVSFKIQLMFGGKERLDATIYSTTNSSKVLVEKSNGTRLLFDGEEVWIHPKDSLYDGARFDALTWSYFFMAPFKLDDPGTHHTTPKKMPYQNSDSLMTTKMTFGENVGDAPDDWYIVYQNDKSQLLEAMAYIVTFGDRDPDKASQNPHAITYANYGKVDGMSFANKWKFWNWSAKEGLQDQLGEASISNIQFSDDYSIFDKNREAVKIGL